MKKAYIIIAHENPSQVIRLIHKLNDDYSDFYVHIDGKSDISEFRGLGQFKEKVRLVKREKVYWAGYSQVKAIINSLNEIGSNKEYDYDSIILLSGQDYPIKSNHYINNFISQSPHKIFMEYFKLWDFTRYFDGGQRRIEDYFFGSNLLQRAAAKSINTISKLTGRLRTLDKSLIPYSGSSWWTIDMYTLGYILKYIAQNPSYLKFFKYSPHADEMFFQTILLNTDDERIKSTIMNDNKRFIKWLPLAPHPETLTVQNLDEIKKSEALFARKFKADDTEMYDLLDQLTTEKISG